MTVEDKLGKDGSNDRTIEEKPIDMPCLYTSLSSTFESCQELKNIIESKTQNLKQKRKLKHKLIDMEKNWYTCQSQLLVHFNQHY